MTIRIDPTKPFNATLDLSVYVKKVEDATVRRYDCKICGDTLVLIELGGILGDQLGSLDAAVILDHQFAKHNG